MTLYRLLSFWTGDRKRIFILFFCVVPPSQYPPSGFAGHLLINKEAYPIPILPVRIPFLNTVTNPLLSLWMTPYWFPTMGADPSYPLSMTINVSLIMTPFPPIVILNGGKNALWEGRETGWWHGVKNLLPWMASYRFSSPWWQILHVRLWWRLTFPSLWRAFPKSSFRTGVRMLCEKAGKRLCDTEWRIYYPDDILPFSSLQQQTLHIRLG